MKGGKGSEKEEMVRFDSKFSIDSNNFISVFTRYFSGLSFFSRR